MTWSASMTTCVSSTGTGGGAGMLTVPWPPPLPGAGCIVLTSRLSGGWTGSTFVMWTTPFSSVQVYIVSAAATAAARREVPKTRNVTVFRFMVQ